MRTTIGGPAGQVAFDFPRSCPIDANTFIRPVSFHTVDGLDRLQALWQASATGERIAYGGSRHDPTDPASTDVDRVLNLSSIFSSIPVLVAGDTFDRFLCY